MAKFNEVWEEESVRVNKTKKRTPRERIRFNFNRIKRHFLARASRAKIDRRLVARSCKFLART